MSGIGVGLVLFGVMLALLVLRVPIGIAMFTRRRRRLRLPHRRRPGRRCSTR